MLALCVLTSCSQGQVPVSITGATMGTTWSVAYIEPADTPYVEELFGGIQGILDEIDSSLSTYQADSEISAFNRLPLNSWTRPSPAFFQVLRTALDVGKRSEGAYDVTVAPLVDLWGFGPGDSGAAAVPPVQKIEALRERIGQQNLRLDTGEDKIMKLSKVSLDFSSLAKGYAVDRVAGWLSERGIARFMVEVGGEMRLSGLSGRGDPWRIAIEQPDSRLHSVAAAMSLTDISIATSGDYRNFFEVDGQRFSHMIDPRTGHPVAHDLVSVTVAHPECMVADAWATALVVLGAERAMAVAREQGLAVYFIRRAGDEFVHSHTPLFSGYLAGKEVRGGA